MSEAMDKIFERELFDWQRDKINLDDPQFKEASRVMDWRNHVPYEIKKVWDKLSLEEKKVIAYFAENGAQREDWD